MYHAGTWGCPHEPREGPQARTGVGMAVAGVQEVWPKINNAKALLGPETYATHQRFGRFQAIVLLTFGVQVVGFQI